MRMTKEKKIRQKIHANKCAACLSEPKNNIKLLFNCNRCMYAATQG